MTAAERVFKNEQGADGDITLILGNAEVSYL